MTWLRPRPNPRHGWFSGVRNGVRRAKGNAKAWTPIGHAERSRPRDCIAARVFHRLCRFFKVTGCTMRPAFGNGRTEKPLGWQHDQPGQDASFSTNRPLFRVARKPWEGEENPTVLSTTTTCEPGDLPSTGMVPTLGRFPRCQHGGCRGDVLHPRVLVDPTVPIRLCGSCIQLLFALV